MPNKVTRFDNIIGNRNTIAFLQSHLNRGTTPRCIIFEGEEGLGKTSLAKLVAMGINCSGDVKPCYNCPSCRSIMKNIIEDNRDTDSVKVFNMSVDSGKDAAKLVKSNLNTNMSDTGKRVIICDEAHAMSDAAQDVFLVDMEYLPKDVYLFFCTTDSQNLKKTLKSRAFTIPLHKPTQSELVGLLAETAVKRGLEVQQTRATLNLIASWAECKPRKALNLLEGFGENTVVSAAAVKEFISYIDIGEVIPILDALGGSLTMGLAYAQEMNINPAIIDVMSDILTLKMGGICRRFSTQDIKDLHGYLSRITEETLITFLMALTRHTTLTRGTFIGALLEAHSSKKEVFNHDPAVLQDELAQKATIPKPIVAAKQTTGVSKAPRLDALLQKSNQVK